MGHLPPVIDSNVGNVCPVDDKVNLSVWKLTASG